MAATPRISTKTDLKDYIVRQLGGDAVQIELSDDNLEDAIALAVEEYLPNAYSGVAHRFLTVDLLAGSQEYILPYSVFAVLRIHSQNMQGIGNSVPSNLFSVNNFIAADLYRPGTGKIDLITYESVNEMIETMELMFSRQLTFDFNSITKKLHIFSPVQDEKIALEVYMKIDDFITVDPTKPTRTQEENIYNERWIKKMAVAQAQMQWAKNHLKYQGSLLPNGGNLNMEFLYNEAKEQVEKYSEELMSTYTLPIDFYVG